MSKHDLKSISGLVDYGNELLTMISDIAIKESEETKRWKPSHDINGKVGEFRSTLALLKREGDRLNALMAPFQPGQIDPTPQWNPSGIAQCGWASHEGQLANGARCTWPAHHPVEWSHVAGDGQRIVAVW